MENLTQKQIDLIGRALSTQIRENEKTISTFESMNWNNVGNFKEMYANEQAFNEMKKNTIEELTAENNQLQDLLDKTMEY